MAESRVIASKEEAKYYPYTGIFKWARESYWTAGQDSYTAPPAQDPDMFLQLTNVEPVTRGILQRRRGYTLFSNQTPSTPFLRAFAFRSEALALRRLVWTSTSTVLTTDETGLNILSPLFTPGSAARAPRMVLSRDFGYFADGVAADYKKWDGTQFASGLTNWGIALNTSATGPNNAGTAADQGSTGVNGSQGPLNCGTGADVAIGGGTAWSSPGSIATLNGNASVTLAANGGTSDYLTASNFGFSIPGTATILGITASITRSANLSNTFKDNIVQLTKAGVRTGNNKANGSTWPTTKATFNYGASTDLWGAAWLATDINNSGFGVVLSAINTSATTTTNGFVYAFVTITVYYSIPGQPWTNPGNITGACDGVVATAIASTGATNDLRATNFAFAAVPAAGTITGIQVSITASTSSAGIPVMLNPIMVKAGTIVGQRKTLNVSSTSLTAYTFGGQFDLWQTAWLPSDINGVNTFGVQFNGSTVSNQATLSIDCVQITIFTQAGPITLGATAGGNITLISGRTYFYTFENSKTGHNSTLSPASASTGALSSKQQPLSGIPVPADTQVDTVLILATADGNDQTTLFLLGSVPAGTTTFTDNTPDTTLLTQPVFQQTDSIGLLHGVANNNPPPTADFPIKHKGRLYMAQGHSLFFSKNLDDVTTSTGTITGKWEEAWPFTNAIDLSEFSETIRALLSDGETLWIGTERNIRRLIGDGPLNFQKPEIQFNECGVLNPEVWKVVFYEGQPVGTMWMTPDFRVMSSDFNTYMDVGTPIQDVLNSINPSAVQACHAQYVNKQAFDLYILYIPTGSNTVADTALVYNLRTRKWCVWQPTDGISASVFNIDVNGVPQWLFATGAGPLYFWDSTVLQDRNGNTPVSYPVTIQTTWQDCGDFTWWKVLNLQILASDDSALTLAIDGAVTNSDFLSPTAVLTATTVVPSELRNYLQLPLSTTQARHYWFRFTWTSPASTVQNILTSVHTEVVPFSRF